jgi:lipopolysaccharide transport system permease protein
MARELFEARELIGRLFLRNLFARYKQAFLGALWAVILPAVAIGVFVLLKRAGVVDIGPTGVPYPLFALVGLTVWQFFASGLSAGCGALVEAGDMIAKVNFPREVLVVASLAQAVVDLAVKLVLIVLVCAWYGFVPSWTALLFPLALIPVFFLTLAGALFLSLLNAVFRDTAQAVPSVLMFGMFLTPVLYPISPDKGWLFAFNPLASLVDTPRALFLYGTCPDPAGFFMASTLSLLVFLMAWRLFHLAETKIPERI